MVNDIEPSIECEDFSILYEMRVSFVYNDFECETLACFQIQIGHPVQEQIEPLSEDELLELFNIDVLPNVLELYECGDDEIEHVVNETFTEIEQYRREFDALDLDAEQSLLVLIEKERLENEKIRLELETLKNHASETVPDRDVSIKGEDIDHDSRDRQSVHDSVHESVHEPEVQQESAPPVLIGIPREISIPVISEISTDEALPVLNSISTDEVVSPISSVEDPDQEPPPELVGIPVASSSTNATPNIPQRPRPFSAILNSITKSQTPETVVPVSSRIVVPTNLNEPEIPEKKKWFKNILKTDTVNDSLQKRQLLAFALEEYKKYLHETLPCAQTPLQYIQQISTMCVEMYSEINTKVAVGKLTKVKASVVRELDKYTVQYYEELRGSCVGRIGRQVLDIVASIGEAISADLFRDQAELTTQIESCHSEMKKTCLNGLGFDGDGNLNFDVVSIRKEVCETLDKEVEEMRRVLLVKYEKFCKKGKKKAVQRDDKLIVGWQFGKSDDDLYKHTPTTVQNGRASTNSTVASEVCLNCDKKAGYGKSKLFCGKKCEAEVMKQQSQIMKN